MRNSNTRTFSVFPNSATNLNNVDTKAAKAPEMLRLRPFSGLFWYFVVQPAGAMHVCTECIAFRNVTSECEVCVSNYVTVSNVSA